MAEQIPEPTEAPAFEFDLTSEPNPLDVVEEIKMDLIGRGTYRGCSMEYNDGRIVKVRFWCET